MSAVMRPAQGELDWSDANQRLLVAELALLRAGLDPQDADFTALGAEFEDAAATMPAPGALDRIAQAFALTPFERSLLLLCAGAEMDSRIADLCGNGRRAGPSFGFALAALGQAHWSALAPARPLRRWRLVELEASLLLTNAPLRIDERILHYLAGLNSLDTRLQPLLRPQEPGALMSQVHVRLAHTIAAMAAHARNPRTVHLGGDDAAGAEDVAAAAAVRWGLQLHVLFSSDVPSAAAELETFATLWEREAVLLPSALLVQCGESSVEAPVVALAQRLHCPLFVASRERPQLRCAALQFEVSKPVPGEQKRLWQLALGSTGAGLERELDGVAAQFRLSGRAIAQAADAASERMAGGESPSEALWQTCRSSGRQRLDDLAQPIASGAGWDDLVLPPSQLALLRQVAAQVRQRVRVHEEWGFGKRQSRGLGVSALFCGESGTGKTLAAEVLAGELHLDLYRIDLSSVVNKYIGETEKNLRRVFDAAEDSGAILLFDEADALFGKRSDVKDSHDRYANIEVSYLLQRMEAYRGLAILTTNLKSALDSAFQRRLRFIVHFPFPDAAQREAIWRRALPPEAPTSEIDFAQLARLHVAGGAVRNIALNAAFLAAEAEQPLGMTHLLAAAQAESAKLERPLSSTERRGWT